MDVAEPATGVVADAGTVAPDRAQMKTVYVLALVSFVILPLIAYSFSGPRWGFFASFLLGGGALLTALVLMVVMFMTIPGASRRRRVIAAIPAALIPAIATASAVLVGTLIARVCASRKLSPTDPTDPTEEAHE